MSITVYKESQAFRQKWVIAILIICCLFAIYPLMMQLGFGESIGNKPLSIGEAILLFALSIGVSLLFYLFRLDTEISKEGISARFFPLHQKFRRFAWDSIESIEVRKYKPIWDYGGWGLRFSQKNKAWTISGNLGIQIKFKNGKALLIGTKDPEAVKNILTDLQKA